MPGDVRGSTRAPPPSASKTARSDSQPASIASHGVPLRLPRRAIQTAAFSSRRRVEIARITIDQDPAVFVRRERRLDKFRQRRLAKQVIDHLQKNCGRASAPPRAATRHSAGGISAFHEAHTERRGQRLDRRSNPRLLVPEHHDRFIAPAVACVQQCVRNQGNAAHQHERFGHTSTGAAEAGAAAGGEDDSLGYRVHAMKCIDCGAVRHVHVTFHGLANTSDPARGAAAPGAEASPAADRFQRDTIDILQRLSRRPSIQSPRVSCWRSRVRLLQVLELVGEMEDHFNIAVPLDSLTHIRTVSQIAAEARRLVSGSRCGRDTRAPSPTHSVAAA